MKDLGLSYEEACHGIQSAIRFVMSAKGIPDDQVDPIIRYIKHVRVGVDSSKADMLGLVELLLAKGVFTKDEYIEHMRLAANQELFMHEVHIERDFGLKTSFR